MRHVLLAFALPLLSVAAGCAPSDAAEPAGDSAPVSGNDRHESSASFSCPEIDGEGFSLTHGEATKLDMSSAGKVYPAINVILANYDRQGGSYHPSATSEGQRRLILTFSGAAGQELQPGDYSVDGQMGAENRLSVGMEGSGAHCGLYNGEGSAEILSLDGSTVAGRVSLTDAKASRVEASFSVPYEISRY